jgi:hypothetical protein
MADITAVREITSKLESGIKELFESDKYAEYLKTMSRFHNYSTRNTMLIHMQYPGASRVASYLSWKNNFNRQVKKGEHGIKIFAPVPHNETKEFEKLDPLTKQPIIGDDGQPVTETLMRTGVSFKTVNVFAYEQTTGDPLPELVEPLSGGVERYELFLDALRAVSPLPIVFEDLPESTDGKCFFGDRIAIRNGMSQVQTVSAVVHEITHAKLHDRELNPDFEQKDRRTAEVEAESTAFTTLAAFGVDTGKNSFPYVLEWSKSKELKELNASLDTIRRAAAELIDGIDKEYRELAKQRGIDLTVAPKTEPKEQSAEAIAELAPAAEAPTAMKHAETRPAGETVLMPLLYEDGNLNRSGKRSKVRIEPRIGKYSLYSRDEGDTNYTYMMTDGGKLIMLGDTARLGGLTEQKIDEHLTALTAAFETQMSDPDKWADFNAAAILDRIPDADAHNTPIRNRREAEYKQEAETRAAEREAERKDKEDAFNATVDEIADKLVKGEKADVAPDPRMEKNPLLTLFVKHGVELPLATKGWVNKNLKAVQIKGGGDNSFSISLWLPKGKKGSETFRKAVWELRNKIVAIRDRAKPAIGGSDVKIGMIGGMSAEIHDGGTPPPTPAPKRSVPKDLCEKMWERFPRFMSKEYSYLRLESSGFEPLSLEWVGGDRFSMMHTYKLNGELCYDPDIVFEVDRDAHTLSAVQFQQSMPPLYQERQDTGEWLSVDGNGNQRTINGLEKSINDFAKQWLINIGEQGHIPVRANLEIDGKETQITFTKDGDPIFPEPETPEGEPPKTIDLSLPDPAWTVAELAEYGYTEPDMYPLSVGRAVELFDTGHTIYLLYPDNTEAVAFDRDEIITFSSDGFCGITKTDWELSPVRDAQNKVYESVIINREQIENSKESELIHSGVGMFGIYQIRDDIDGARNVRFAPMRELEALGLKVDRENYKLVYTGELPIRDTQTNLHRIYQEFQHDSPKCPQDFTCPSVSVSDVIVLQWRGEVSAHFVDSAGFKELPLFTGNEREQKTALTAQEAANIPKAAPDTRERTTTATPEKKPQPPLSKAKPSLLGRLEAKKRTVAQRKQAANPIQAERRNDNERAIHGS